MAKKEFKPNRYLPEALKLLREYHNFNQKEVADALGMSQSMVCELESGVKDPSLETINKYAIVFRIQPWCILWLAELIDDEEENHLIKYTYQYENGKKRLEVFMNWWSGRKSFSLKSLKENSDDYE